MTDDVFTDAVAAHVFPQKLCRINIHRLAKKTTIK